MHTTRPDPLSEYHELVHYGLSVGEAPGFSNVREELASLTLPAALSRELAELDAGALYEILHNEDIQDYLLQDDPVQPLSHWWWHLGALRAGRYPQALLPEPLRAYYRQRETA